MLPGSLRTAFSYITMLEHKDKPDYNLVKLYLSFDLEDEQRIFSTQLIIQNERLARDVLFDAGEINRENNNQEEAKVSQIDEMGQVIYDADEDFQFDIDTDE